MLFSGTLTPRNVRRIVELGDGWIPIMGETPDGVADGAARLRTAYEAAGRDPATLRVRTHLPVVRGDVAATIACAAAMAERGVTDVVLPLAAFVRTVEARDPWFADVAQVLTQ